jgi:hypothetical protein
MLRPLRDKIGIMNRFLRALTIWIVALAMPLQGYAAAAMIACGPMHSQMASSLDHPASHDDHVAVGHSHHSMDGASGEANGHDPSSLAKFMKFKCSACASCCTASAAPSPVVPFSGVMQAHAEAIPFFGSSEDTIVPDRLERPPRTSLV